jgi:frataxin
LTINLGKTGCWVLNRQSPNRQIWWSSPISGPRRYEFDGTKWNSTQVSSDLFNDLKDELKAVTGCEINFAS